MNVSDINILKRNYLVIRASGPRALLESRGTRSLFRAPEGVPVLLAAVALQSRRRRICLFLIRGWSDLFANIPYEPVFMEGI